MAGFTKLHSGIIDSSIWEEDYATRIVWITFLAKADRSGNVIGVSKRHAASANVSLAEYDRAIEILSSPDPNSKTPDHEGRRIIPIPGGWHLVNYAKYRQRRDPERRREQNREAKRRQRKRKKESAISQPSQPNVSKSQPNAEAEADKEKHTKEKTRQPKGFVLPPDKQRWNDIAFRVGLTEKEAQDSYTNFAANGWKRANQIPIDSWEQVPHVLMYWRNNRGQFQKNDNPPPNPVCRGKDGKTPRQRALEQYGH
jgi:hypothetical protein